MAKSKSQPKPRILDLYSEARAAQVESTKSPSSQSGQKATTTKKES